MRSIKLLFCFFLCFTVVITSCSKKQDYQNANESSPVSVMEDNNIDKSGEIELRTKDIEKTRQKIYELTKKLDGYIYYESSSTNSDNEVIMQINIALYNDAFLDFFNDARTFGALSSSEIRASLPSNIAEYQPSTSTIEKSVNKRTSTIKITINRNRNIGSCIQTTINGLNNIFYIFSPGIIILYILTIVFSLLFFFSYILYYCVFKKIYTFIQKRITKS